MLLLTSYCYLLRRQKCIDALGRNAFEDVYAYLTRGEPKDDDKSVRADLVKIVGKKDLEHVVSSQCHHMLLEAVVE